MEYSSRYTEEKRKYLIITFLTFFGIKKIVDLGPVYGEAVIYENKIPKFLVDFFDPIAESNILMEKLIKKERSLDIIISSINKRCGVNLTMEGWPLIGIKTKEVSEELDLKPLPIEWIRKAYP